jgi:toxin secretion/phage lysis holin
VDKKKALVVLTGLIINALGPPSALLDILIACIALDYITGVLRAAYERRMNSRIGARGIIKKISYLTAVALAHQIDLWLGTGNALRSLSMSLFIGNEAWSNVENLAAMGIVFPKPVIEKIKEMMDATQKGDMECPGRKSSNAQSAGRK